MPVSDTQIIVVADTGIQGPIGPQGIQGTTGNTGSQGIQGIPGPQNLYIQNGQPTTPVPGSLWIPLNPDGSLTPIDQWQVYS